VKVQAQIPRKFLGFRLPFLYKNVEIELDDYGLITIDPVLQKGEEVRINYVYKGKS
jgi:hypothetical protein